MTNSTLSTKWIKWSIVICKIYHNLYYVGYAIYKNVLSVIFSNENSLSFSLKQIAKIFFVACKLRRLNSQ